MSAEQVPGTPAPAASPAAEGEYDRQQSVAQMVSVLEHTAKEGEDAGEAPADGKPAPVEGEKPPAAAPKPEFSVEATRQKLTEVLSGLTEDQIEEVLGATNEAFAAITAKSQRLRKRTEEFLQAQHAFDLEKKEHAEIRQELDQALTEGRKNPIYALELFGWTLADAHAFVTNGEELPVSKQLELTKEELRAEYEKKLGESTKEREERENQERAEANKRVWHDGVARAIREVVTPEAMPNLAWYIERYGAGSLQKAVIDMQTKVFEHFQGRKILDEKTALAQIEADEDLAALRRGYVASADPARAGAVKTAKPEAGREPSPSLSASATGERHSPPVEEGDEDLSREARIARMVALAKSG